MDPHGATSTQQTCVSCVSCATHCTRPGACSQARCDETPRGGHVLLGRDWRQRSSRQFQTAVSAVRRKYFRLRVRLFLSGWFRKALRGRGRCLRACLGLLGKSRLTSALLPECVAPRSQVSHPAVSDPSPSASGRSHSSSHLVLFSSRYICYCLISLGLWVWPSSPYYSFHKGWLLFPATRRKRCFIGSPQRGLIPTLCDLYLVDKTFSKKCSLSQLFRLGIYFPIETA